MTANGQFEHSLIARLHTLSEELHAINTQIIANLETLPEQTELVGRLISQCDDIALELDAIRMELRVSSDGSAGGEMIKAESSADGSGLKP
jgi:hypothetical protein